MKANPDPNKEVHGLNIGKLWAHEKCLMQHNRCGEHGMPGAQLICPSQAIVGRHLCQDRHGGHGGVG